MILKCQCCGIEREFADGKEAYRAGWDAPPYFSQVRCCNLCPASCIVLGYSHRIAHALWAAVGRPDDFGPNCYPDRDWGQKLDYKGVLRVLDPELGSALERLTPEARAALHRYLTGDA